MYATTDQILKLTDFISQLSELCEEMDRKITALSKLPELTHAEICRLDQKTENLNGQTDLLLQMSNTLSEYCANHNSRLDNHSDRIDQIFTMCEKMQEMIKIVAGVVDPRFIQ